MFQSTDFTTIYMVAVALLFFLLLTITVWKHRSGEDPLKAAIFRMKIFMIGFGILVAVMMFSLPSRAVLNSFGYPETVEEINDQEKLLYLLQEYNQGIVRLSDVLRMFFSTVVFWFIIAFYFFLDALKKKEISF